MMVGSRDASRPHEAAAIKQSASGRWPEVISRLGGIPAEILDGRHHPCPKCGGTDRFRALDDFEQSGALFCNQCFAKANGDGIAALQWLCGWDFSTTLRELAGFVGIKGNGHSGNGHANGNGKARIVASYDYRDAAGNLLYQVCRMEPKDFRQRAPQADGTGWTWKTKGLRKVPYRLPELLTADPAGLVFIVEGEKDIDRLAGLGLVGTCNVGGAGKWRPEYNQHFSGRRVAIIPDNDEPGRKHAHEVAQSLQGVAASVKLVELPGLLPKGDVSDWLDAGGTVEELQRLVDAAAEWEPTESDEAKPIIVGEGELLLTDLGNARRFVVQHAHRARFCHPWGKWLIWDGRRWAVDRTGAAERLAKETARSILVEASREPDKDRMRELAKFAVASQSIARLTSMLRGAQSEPEIAILPEVLDVDPWLLNVENGTIDLRTGELRPHCQSDYLTKLAPVEYHPDAEYLTWRDILWRIFAERIELIECLQRWAGYALTALATESVLPIWYGVGANGKSTVANALLELMGTDYSMKAPPDLLMAKRGESHPTERSDLFGKRLVVCNETDEGRRLAESLVKDLTGGDRIRARRMREDFWEFRPTHKLVICTNHRPEVRGSDHAIWRRLRLVPFTVVIPDHEQDKRLGEKLRDELPGILAWAVRGCLWWQREGLAWPADVTRATEEYRADQDVIAAFIADCCIVDERMRVKATPLFDAYKAWCEQTGEAVVSQRRFGAAMSERGFKRYTNNGRWYAGLGLNDSTEGK